jgi:hypothetical protein
MVSVLPAFCCSGFSLGAPYFFWVLGYYLIYLFAPHIRCGESRLLLFTSSHPVNSRGCHGPFVEPQTGNQEDAGVDWTELRAGSGRPGDCFNWTWAEAA